MRKLLTLFVSFSFLSISNCLAETATQINEAITGEVSTETQDEFDTDCCEYNVYYGTCVKDTSVAGGLRCRPSDIIPDRSSCTDFYPHNTGSHTCDEKNKNPPPIGNCKDKGKVAGSDCRTASALGYIKDAYCDGREGGNATFRCIPKKKEELEVPAEF